MRSLFPHIMAAAMAVVFVSTGVAGAASKSGSSPMEVLKDANDKISAILNKKMPEAKQDEKIRGIVDKLLDYEKDPQVGDWMRTAVLASSVMNPPNANLSNAHDPSHIYNWWEDNAWESSIFGGHRTSSS